MGTFRVQIETDNAAFEDPRELPWVLRQVAELVEQGEERGPTRDSNGNTVGAFETVK